LDVDGIIIIVATKLIRQSHIIPYNILITSLKKQRLRELYKIIQNVMATL
jgi:hypothetical protein